MPNVVLPCLHRSRQQLVFLATVMGMAGCATRPEIDATVGTGKIIEIHAAAALPSGKALGV